MDKKPIYEIFVPIYFTPEQMGRFRNQMEQDQKMKELEKNYHIVVAWGTRQHIVTNIHYPKATFWGFMYKLFRLQ